VPSRLPDTSAVAAAAPLHLIAVDFDADCICHYWRQRYTIT
jgi:hypothetical protein